MPCVFVSFALGLVAPAAAHVAVAAGGITSGRAQAIGALVVGLISVVVGITAKGRRRAIVALVAGLIGVVLAGLRLAASTAIGTGSGRLGAIVALVVALLGTILGARALARTQRAKHVEHR